LKKIRPKMHSSVALFPEAAPSAGRRRFAACKAGVEQRHCSFCQIFLDGYSPSSQHASVPAQARRLKRPLAQHITALTRSAARIMLTNMPARRNSLWSPVIGWLFRA
jgi:hypothetical protein